MSNNELVEKNADLAVTSTLPEVPENFENAVEKSCENCHQPIAGPFCGQCGQQAESTLKYFWVVIMHILDDIFSFDSRAARTLYPLVTRPGFLTKEYFAGRRVHYVPPLRLYLFISIIFFITLKFFVASESSNILNVNDNQTVITKIKNHIDSLKKQQLNAKDQEGQSVDELLKISSELEKYSTLLADINQDYSIEKNKDLIKLTRRLADFELSKIDDEESLNGEDIEDYDRLIAKIAKIKAGEEIEPIKKSVTFGNNADGSFTFDFLSDESNKKLDAFTKRLAEKAEKAFLSDTAPLVQEAIGKLPQLMFILLPIFALLLKIMFIFSKRLYLEHLTVALHSHSFIFFTVLLVELLDIFYDYSETALPSFTGTIEFAIKALLVWIPVYLFIMQKRIYKQGYFFTLLKFSFIGSAYMMLIGFTGVIAFIWGLTDI
jgi:hypothetical protein